MTFLPLVHRELRVRARWPSTFYARLGAAAVGIALAAVMLLAGSFTFLPSRIGQFLFHMLGIIAFLFCSLEGVRTTSDSLSQEKRSGTLGLLFLTDLKGYDVVLGKLMATSLNSFYSLLAIFPALAIPLVLGGITGGEFWRLVLMLTNTLFLSLAVGLCVSSLSFDERKASLATLGIISGLTLVPPALAAGMGGGTVLGLSPSPLLAYLAVNDVRFAGDPAGYWNPMGGMQILGWLLVILASWFLPRHWQARPTENPTRRIDAKLPSTAGRGNPASSVANDARRVLLDVHPVLWLARRKVGDSKPVWLMILVAGLMGAAVQRWAPSPVFLFVSAIILHFFIAVWAAYDASHALAGCRETGSLELLLSTPLSAEDILRGYRQAMQNRFFRPLVGLAVIEAAMVITYAALMSIEENDPLAGLLAYGFLGVTLGVSLLDIVATSYFGLWMGFINKSPIQATIKTVVFVLLLPVTLSVFGLCCGAIWPLVGLIKNVVLINISRDRLKRHFRRLASETYAPRPADSMVGWKIFAKKLPDRDLPSVLPPNQDGP